MVSTTTTDAPKATPTPVKKATTTPKAKTSPSHPPYVNMVSDAIKNLKERNGSSKTAILKFIVSNYKVGDNINSINAHLKVALKRGVETGALKHTKGVGASGSFKLGDKPVSKSKKGPTKKAKAAPTAKKASEKKTAKPKKTTTKKDGKVTKKVKKAQSPKKKQTAVKKSPKKTKAPKKKSSPKKTKVTAKAK